MVTMADWRGTPLPTPLDTIAPISAASFGAPPSPDIRFVVDELWSHEELSGGDLGSLGLVREPWEEEQEHGFSWEQVRVSLNDTPSQGLTSAMPLPLSACSGGTEGAPGSPGTGDGVLPLDAWSPPAGREEPLALPEGSHQGDPALWEPLESTSGEKTNAGACQEDFTLQSQPGEAGCYMSSDSACSGPAQELSRPPSLSNASSLPGPLGNLSTCPESPALLIALEGSGSFQAGASPSEGARGQESYGLASDGQASCAVGSGHATSSPSSSIEMLNAPSPFQIEGHLLDDLDISSPFSGSHPAALTSAELASRGTSPAQQNDLALDSLAVLDRTSQDHTSAEAPSSIPSEARDQRVLPSLGNFDAAPVARQHSTVSINPPSGSLAARLAGLLEGIAKDKKANSNKENNKEHKPVLHEFRDAAAPAGLSGAGAPLAAPVEKRARVQSGAGQEASQEQGPAQNADAALVLLPRTRNPRARRKAATGRVSGAASAVAAPLTGVRSSAASPGGTDGLASSTKAQHAVTNSNATDTSLAVLGSAGRTWVPGAVPGRGTPLVHCPGGPGDAWLSPATAPAFSFVPRGPGIPEGLTAQASCFDDPQFQKQVFGQLMQLATAYSTGEDEVAHRWLIRLRKLASPRSHKLQRMVCYILTGLTQRFEGIAALPQPPPPNAAPEGFQNILEESRHNIRTVHGKVSELAMTVHLVRRLVGHPRVHVVCFTTCLVPDWTSLFAALAGQDGGLKPHVRVSIVVMGHEVSVLPQLLSAYSLLADDVAACALAAGLEVECQMAFTAPQDFRPSLVTVDPQEAVAVTAWMSLQTLPDESVLRHNPRDAVLKWIWGLQPVAFALVELDASYNSPFFLARFAEILRVSAAAFGMRSPERAEAAAASPAPPLCFGDKNENGPPTMLEFKKGLDLVNCIACEGLARYLRAESLALWRDRLLRLGFHQLGYTGGDLARMHREVEDLGLGLSVEDVGGLASMRREGNPLLFAGVWSAGA